VQDLLRRSAKAAQAGDKTRAYLLMAEAAIEDPALWTRAQALRPDAPAPKLPPPPPVNHSITGVVTPRDLAEAKKAAEPPRLKAKTGARSFTFKGRVRSLYQQAGDAFGLMVIFDADLPEGGEVRFALDRADYRTTLRALELATNSFCVPLGEKLILVAPDSPQKRNELELTVTQVLPIPQRSTVQEAQELAVAVQQTLEIRRISLDPQKRLILVRDRYSKVRVAERILTDLMNYRPQVVVDIELLTFSNNRAFNYGLGLPTSSTVVNFGRRVAGNIGWSAAPQNVPFLGFGGGTTFIGLGVAASEAFATYSRGISQSVLHASLTAVDGQAATMHIGDKYPIVTSQFLGAAPRPGENVVAPPPIFNFEDLGLVLKVTPSVHDLKEVSLEVEAEFKTLGGSGFNGIPIISTRKFQSKVRLSTADYAVVAGLVTESEARTLSGIAGLSQIPWVGGLLRRNQVNRDEARALVLLKPRVESLPPSELVRRTWWLGSEAKFFSPL
jgi:hypothetical protein